VAVVSQIQVTHQSPVVSHMARGQNCFSSQQDPSFIIVLKFLVILLMFRHSVFVTSWCRGYYIRAAAVNHSLVNFLRTFSSCRTQVNLATLIYISINIIVMKTLILHYKFSNIVLNIVLYFSANILRVCYLQCSDCWFSRLSTSVLDQIRHIFACDQLSISQTPSILRWISL